MDKEVVSKPKGPQHRRKVILGIIIGGLITLEEATLGGLRQNLGDFFDRNDEEISERPKTKNKEQASEERSEKPRTRDRQPNIIDRNYQFNANPKLTPYTQQFFELGKSEKILARILGQKNYKRSLDTAGVQRRLEELTRSEYSGDTRKQNYLTREYAEEILKSNFITDLEKLKKENGEQKKRVKISLIPLNHGMVNRGEDSDSNSTSSLCMRDVNNIAGTINGNKVSFFLEGLASGERMSEDFFKKISKEEFAAFGIPREEWDHIIKEGHKLVKSTWPWVFDPNFKTFGTEHPSINLLNGEIMQADLGSSSIFFTSFFVHLLREQFAIEYAIFQLNEGENGVILVGAGHIPTMSQYIQDLHPQIEQELIVPKHLFESPK